MTQKELFELYYAPISLFHALVVCMIAFIIVLGPDDQVLSADKM